MGMEEEMLPRQTLEWITHGKRPLRRPRKRWMEGIEEVVRGKERS